MRKRNRLSNYDYSNNGYYYITICTDNRVEWLGNILDDQMTINPYGIICQQCWMDLPNHYNNLFLDAYIIMPNHIHGIIIINNLDKREDYKPSPTDKLYSLSEIIRGFKTFSSKRINEIIKTHNKFKWQRSFHDHIIRNDKSLHNTREYIINNPITWEKDENNINIPVGTGL
ncbi:MAG: transposase [Candidatus Omnitrophota bacterium]